MSFLSWLGKLIIGAILEKITGLLASIAKKVKARQQYKEDAEASVKPLKDAVTGEEIDKATDRALDGF